VNAVDLRQIQFFWALATVLLWALWAVRLWQHGLARRYPLLLAFLVGETLLGLSGILISRSAGTRSLFYMWFWSISRFVSSTLLFLVMVQIYQKLVERYEGFRRLGQIVLYCTLGVAAAIVLGSIWSASHTALQTIEGFWIVEERSVYFALTAVALILLGFAVFFRLVPSRNVLILFGTFGLLFVGETFVWALWGFWGPDFRRIQPLLSTALYFFCIFGGFAAFSPAGERAGSASSRGPQVQSTGGGVAHRLEQINQALLNVFRL
jgi:hypothetical protein